MWVTIWLSGVVSVTLGFAGMTESQCMELRQVVIQDIEQNVVEKDGQVWVKAPNGELLPWQPWMVSCEDQQLPLGTIVD
jgi:hypothetical protein